MNLMLKWEKAPGQWVRNQERLPILDAEDAENILTIR